MSWALLSNLGCHPCQFQHSVAGEADDERKMMVNEDFDKNIQSQREHTLKSLERVKRELNSSLLELKRNISYLSDF